MRITVLSVGHKMPAWIAQGWAEYAKRLPPEIKLALAEIKPEERTPGKTVEKAKALEGERVLAAVPDGATLLALDERGRAVTTQGLAVMLAGWMQDGTNPAFAIGGADGHSDAVRDKAAKLISLSALTLPHGLVRVLLAEQIYRAHTILAKHPYHRE
jgi:23S rRNA (pseudouridine1915-N3)-methyltransferase